MTDKAQEDKWQAEEDERTLTRVKEIQASPSRMKRALAMINKELARKKSVSLDLSKLLQNRK